MKKFILPVLLITALTFLSACSQTSEVPAPEEPENTVETREVLSEGNNTEADVTFVLTGKNFAFETDGQDNPELKVKEGDTVRIEFSSADGFHNWVVDEFDAATEKVQTGDSSSVLFTANKKGTFEYYCSVGKHRANGMKGNLIVE